MNTGNIFRDGMNQVLREQRKISVGFDVNREEIHKGSKVVFDDDMIGIIKAVWEDGCVDIEHSYGHQKPSTDTFNIKSHSVHIATGSEIDELDEDTLEKLKEVDESKTASEKQESSEENLPKPIDSSGSIYSIIHIGDKVSYLDKSDIYIVDEIGPFDKDTDDFIVAIHLADEKPDEDGVFQSTKKVWAGHLTLIEKLKQTNEKQDWDLTFKYSHNQLGSNPIVSKNNEPFLVYKRPTGLKGYSVRVFTEHQAEWVKKNNGVPIREAKIPFTKSDLKRYSQAIVATANTIKSLKNFKEYGGGDTDTDEKVAEGLRKALQHKDLTHQMYALLSDDVQGWVELTKQINAALIKSSRQLRPFVSSGYINVTDVVEDFYGSLHFDKDERGIYIDNMQDIKEKQLSEQTKDNYKVVAKGIADEETAKKVAAEKKGIVVPDEEDPKKFSVLVKETVEKIKESVLELIGEVSDISLEDQGILRWAVENGVIPENFPNYSNMMADLTNLPIAKKIMGEELAKTIKTGEVASKIDIQGLYLKHIFLPQAKKVYQGDIDVESHSFLESIKNESEYDLGLELKMLKRRKRQCIDPKKIEIINAQIRVIEDKLKQKDTQFEKKIDKGLKQSAEDINKIVINYSNDMITRYGLEQAHIIAQHTYERITAMVNARKEKT